MQILEEYKKYCEAGGVPFEDIQDITAPDESTLFCSAGMQRFKKDFVDINVKKTIATNQLCLRVGDIDSIGDGTHLACFNMLGLFSFRETSIKDAVGFWLGFMKKIGVRIDEAHVHPDKKEWSEFCPEDVKIVLDNECSWSDGKVGGYCTEFYVNGLEVGNIVNPLGDCIDVGFGLERLDQIVNGTPPKSREELLAGACVAIVKTGVEPSNKKQGYILRKMLRELKDSNLNIPHLKKEKERQKKMYQRYEKLKEKFPNQTKEWWFETHGIYL